MSTDQNNNETTETVSQIVLNVTGMHYASCVARVEKQLSAIEGVRHVMVNLLTGTVSIQYQSDLSSPPEFIKKIRDLGYNVKTEKKRFRIEGMHCASCVSRVETVFQKFPGVLTSQVNILTREALLEILPGTQTLQDMQNRLASEGGYEIHETQTDFLKSGKVASEQDYSQKFRQRLRGGIILSLVIMILSMLPMIQGMPQISNRILHPLLFFLTLPVIFWVGGSFYSSAFKQLRHGSADMNTLVAISTGTAFLYSGIVTWFPFWIADTGAKLHVYFDTAAMIITLILLGRYLESRARHRSSEAIHKLMNLQPKFAHVLQGNQVVELPIKQIQRNQICRIKPGELIPVDGKIVQGITTVNESMMTGESLPLEKGIGDTVIGGTLNITGSFDMKAQKIGESTMLARIIRLVHEAQSGKAPIQRLADRVAGIFVPTVIVIALLTFIIWILFVPNLVFTQAMLRFIAVLIIACPCALGLATPTAIMVGSGIGAENGILIKGGAVLERIHHADTVIFDKTGTLTQNKPTVTQIRCCSGVSEKRLIILAASAEQHSEHPLAKAIVQYAKDHSLTFEPITKFRSHPGFGIEAKWNNQLLIVGNPHFFNQHDIDIKPFQETLEHWERLKHSIVMVALNREIQGMLALTDPLRPEAVHVIRKLKQKGLTTVLLSGDQNEVSRQIGKDLEIDLVYSEVLPEKKAAVVRELQQKGHKVTMVGDGINDAPALAAADVSIAMESGTDQAIETADITLIKNNLWSVVHAISLSKKTLRTIKQNLFWAFFYNIIGIPIAAGVLYPMWGILLNPVFAAAAMSLSSVSVVTNALRLKRKSKSIFKKRS